MKKCLNGSQTLLTSSVGIDLYITPPALHKNNQEIFHTRFYHINERSTNRIRRHIGLSHFNLKLCLTHLDFKRSRIKQFQEIVIETGKGAMFCSFSFIPSTNELLREEKRFSFCPN